MFKKYFFRKWFLLKIFIVLLDVLAILIWDGSKSNVDWLAAMIIAIFIFLAFYFWIRFFCPESDGKLKFTTFAIDRFFPFKSFPVRSTFIMGLGCLVGGTVRALVAIAYTRTIDPTCVLFIFIGIGMVVAALFAPIKRQPKHHQ